MVMQCPLGFSHNRHDSFRKSCDALKGVIDAFAEDARLQPLYEYFLLDYNLPEDTVKQQIKIFFERSYDYVNCRFKKRLFPGNRFMRLLRHMAFLCYVCLMSRYYGRIDIKHYELIIEWVASGREMARFGKLIDMFGRGNVLITSLVKDSPEGYNVLYRPSGRYYDIAQSLRALWAEATRGLWLCLKLSAELDVNILAISRHIINQCLYYRGLFKYNQAKYCLQERHYQTSAIKNFIFHEYGGRYSACLQKNIHQLGSTGFYYDIDVFFSLGKKTAERALNYGARIGQVVPTGSMFMEHYWFGRAGKQEMPRRKYDIVFLGVNYGPAYRKTSGVNCYASFENDYYEAYGWLIRFAMDNPGLKIGIKHHMDHRGDEKEAVMISKSSIEIIDASLNSYEVVFASRCAATFCSTMGYELLGHGLAVIFLDPGRRNIKILPEDSLIDEWRAVSYEDFCSKMTRAMTAGAGDYQKTLPEDLCLESSCACRRIYDFLSSGERL
ncbi:MAG: hypothetical protein WC487_02510 [Candidatus Omnitrophota bacterium]